jgi:major vault protein
VLLVQAKQTEELEQKRKIDEIETSRQRLLSEIASNKQAAIISALGQSTMQAIAAAAPESQARLLKAMGIKSVLITDGKSPINLFSAANQMVGNGSVVAHPASAPNNVNTEVVE